VSQRLSWWGKSVVAHRLATWVLVNPYQVMGGDSANEGQRVVGHLQKGAGSHLSNDNKSSDH